MYKIMLSLPLAFSFISTPTYAIGEGANFKNCRAGEVQKLFGAFSILANTVSSDYGNFYQCLNSAYLVENRGKNAHDIARRYVNSKISNVECARLRQNVNAEAPVKISREKLRIDHSFTTNQSERRIAAVIAHELAHNYGFRHSKNYFGSAFYSNTVPEQVEACIQNGRPNPKPMIRDPAIRNIVGMAVDGDNNFNFVWYRDGTVSAGTSDNLASKRKPYRYKLPAGKTPNDIVGMAVDGSNNFNFVWYRDGTVSAGTSNNLASKRKPYRYKLPTGKTPNDIVGMGIDGDSNYVFAWYRDGTVSAGTSDHLDSRRRPYPYTLPAGKTPNDIIGMALDGDNNSVYAWFKDGTVSSGNTENMLLKRPPYPYQTGR